MRAPCPALHVPVRRKCPSHVTCAPHHTYTTYTCPGSARARSGFVGDPDTPSVQKYAASALWGIGMVTGLNSEVHASNHTERTFSIVVYVVSALFFAFTIASSVPLGAPTDPHACTHEQDARDARDAGPCARRSRHARQSSECACSSE